MYAETPLPAAMISSAQACAALSWLLESGVDTLVTDTPRNWLAPPPVPEVVPAPAVKAPAPAPVSAAAPRMVPAATSLAALDGDVAAYPHPLRPAPGAVPCLFEGPEAARLLIVDDLASREDSDTARLQSAMLAAIGLDAASVARVHALPWPTTGGRSPRAEELADFAPFAAAAVRLARPGAVLVFGPHLASLVGPQAPALGQLATLGDAALMITLSPSRLLRAPKLKAEAWAHLQALAALLG
jgi:DNA polymerase